MHEADDSNAAPAFAGAAVPHSGHTAAEDRLCRILASIRDRPGSRAQFLTLIASTGASIKEVTHDRNFGPADVWRVGVTW